MRGIVAISILCLFCETTAADDEQAARDSTIVETLLRLKTIDVNSNAKLKDAVMRHLLLHKGTEKYVDLIDRLNVQGVEPQLLEIALAAPDSTAGVRAGGLLLSRGQTEPIVRAINGDDEAVAAKAVSLDRKSTRLNSSHLVISYAVFCLKKKKRKKKKNNTSSRTALHST